MPISDATKQKFQDAFQSLQTDAPNLAARLQLIVQKWNQDTGNNMNLLQWMFMQFKQWAYQKELGEAVQQVQAQKQTEAESEANAAAQAIIDAAEN